MDWKDLAAPVIKLGGTAIGSMLGMPGIGAAAGQIIASTLGVDATPDAVGAAIETPTAATVSAIKEADSKAEVAWAEYAKVQVQETGNTMRAEIAAGVSWWHWRHLLGYVVGGWMAGIAVAFVRLMWIADSGQIANVTILLNSGFAYFGAGCGLLGYVAMDTSRRTTAAATGEQIPTVLGNIIKAVTKRK